jgi:hypothetical protein
VLQGDTASTGPFHDSSTHTCQEPHCRLDHGVHIAVSLSSGNGHLHLHHSGREEVAPKRKDARTLHLAKSDAERTGPHRFGQVSRCHRRLFPNAHKALKAPLGSAWARPGHAAQEGQDSVQGGRQVVAVLAHKHAVHGHAPTNQGPVSGVQAQHSGQGTEDSLDHGCSTARGE